MIKTKLHSVGGSIDLRIPKTIVESLELSANMEVDLSIANGCLIAKPTSKRPRYTLAELLAKCDPSIPMTSEDREWLDTEPVGEELI
jgi:antitoxin ChpS